MLGCSPGKHVMRGTHFAFLKCCGENISSRLFHLSFAFWTYYKFPGHAPGMEKQPLLSRAALWVGKARGSLTEMFIFAVPVHQTIQVCHRAWIFIPFLPYARVEQKKRKKNVQFLYFFLRYFCMRRYQHNKIFYSVSEKDKNKIKTWPPLNGSHLILLPADVTTFSPKSQHQLYFNIRDARLSLKQVAHICCKGLDHINPCWILGCQGHRTETLWLWLLLEEQCWFLLSCVTGNVELFGCSVAWLFIYLVVLYGAELLILIFELFSQAAAFVVFSKKLPPV